MDSETFLAFAECFTEAMMMVSPHGDIIATNSAGLNLLNQGKPPNVEGRSLNQFFIDEEGKLGQYLAACVGTDVPLTGVLRLQSDERSQQIICQGRSARPSDTSPCIILRCLLQSDTDLDTQVINSSLLQLTAEIERRRLVEQRLSISEAQAQAVLDTAVDGIITIDRDGVIESFNKAAERIFGYQASEVLGNRIECLMPQPFRSEHKSYIQRYLSTGEKRVIDKDRREVTGQRKDGTTFPLELAVSEVAFGGFHHFTGIVRDISRRKQAEQRLQKRELEARQHRERLVHVARLSTMGEMAAGIAHEINQPLTAIATYASACHRLLKSGLSDEEELLTALDKINLQARRAGNVIQRLRGFVKKQDSQREVWDLNKLIADTMVLAETDARLHAFTIEISCYDSPLMVSVDPVQIQQVLLNLIRNGMDAMLEANEVDGCLWVSAQQEDQDFARVSVRDQGIGIAPEQNDKLFSPFFTTKANGIGLGLSISRSIINAHGGHLKFECNADKGVTMYFTLPLELGIANG